MNQNDHSGPLDHAGANTLLAQVDAHPSIVHIAQAARRLAELKPLLSRVSLRLAFLSSFTSEPLRSPLELQGLHAGFGVDLYLAPFGQYEQELINPSSGLVSFKPDVVVVAVRLLDACPAVYDAFNSLSAAPALELVNDWLARLATALRSFRTGCKAHILIQNCEQPVSPSLGIADQGAAGSQIALIRRTNDDLAALARSIPNVYVMDYDALVARHGRLDWTDRRLASYARLPVAAKYHWALAGFYVRHIRPLYGLTRKVLVLDADNTLWGGVVGDVGLEGIALGHDYPGNAFVAFQKRILELYHRGVVLCLASKNQPGIVEEVLDKHPEMILRREHFAAMRIDWNHKPDSLRAMAVDLNLGLDSFVFMDDSPVECELMRQSLPEVLTVPLPPDPAYYAATLEEMDCFDQWSFSEEDQQRGKLYKAEAGRRALQSTVTDLPTFYRQLRMKMTLSINKPAHVVRASQMTHRTNQFNMHTIRCSEDDIRRFMTAADHRVITLALEDRFGDNGIVGLAVVRTDPEEWTLHLFLMSCRVLGRTVEQTFVGWIAEQARHAGAKRLVGLLKPTSKNKPFAGFYPDSGFVQAGVDGEVRRWVWELAAAETAPPDWFEIEVS